MGIGLTAPALNILNGNGGEGWRRFPGSIYP